MPSPTTTYHHLHSRLTSLSSPTLLHTTSKKKVKALPSTLIPLLAQNGFYRSSSSHLCCFCCSSSLPISSLPVEESEPDESHLTSLHLSLSPDCSWALIRRLNWVPTAEDLGGKKNKIPSKKSWQAKWGENGEWHPRSRKMEEVRRGTFGQGLGWPRGAEEGWNELVEKIIKAGWYFRPGDSSSSLEELDSCSCLYCGKSVSGWSLDDDPIADHKRNIGLNCPFFLAGDAPETVEEEQAEVEVAEEKGMKRSERRTKLSEDAAPEEESTKTKSTRASTKKIEPVVEIPTQTRTRSRAGSVDSSTTTGTKGRSTRGKGKKKVVEEKEEEVLVEEEQEKEEDVEIEEEKEVKVVPTAIAKKSRGGKKSTKKAPSPAPSSPANTKKSIPSRKGTRATSVVPEVAIEEEAAVVGGDIVEIVEVEEETEDVEMVEEPKKVKGKKAKKVGKGKRVVEPEPETEVGEEMEVEVEEPASSKGKPSAKSKAPLTPIVSPITSPRLIRSLPSKVNSTSKPFIPHPITSEELAMTLGEYYDHVGRRTYEGLKDALREEEEGFVRKAEGAREVIEALVERARRR